MVRTYPKRFPLGTVKILYVRSARQPGPFKILNKQNCNTYVIDLSRDYDINCIFNINNLVDYKDFDCSLMIDKPFPKLFSESSPLQNTHPLQEKELITF